MHEAIEIAEQYGWKYKSTNGDHHKFVKEGKRPVIIPGKRNDDLAKGTEKSIMNALKN